MCSKLQGGFCTLACSHSYILQANTIRYGAFIVLIYSCPTYISGQQTDIHATQLPSIADIVLLPCVLEYTDAKYTELL